MPKRSRKKKLPADVNRLAKSIVGDAISEDEPETEPKLTGEGKNPAAVALGRLGGKKGGPARANKLTAEQRSEIARKAAECRWGKKKRK